MHSNVFIHIVTYNHADCIGPCLNALSVAASGATIEVTDNASSDDTASTVRANHITLIQNTTNLGFSAAHNQGVKRFLESKCDYLLILNPDVILNDSTLDGLIHAIKKLPSAGMATPKLLRCDMNMQELSPSIIDAAGMKLTKSLRHFDRGSQEHNNNSYNHMGLVFGGTGACLLITRNCVSDLLLPSITEDIAITKVYPSIPTAEGTRCELFDEAFFAYREDADLAWRAQYLGWDCVYAPQALALHRRVVTPERRNKLPPEINLLGVQNRFLLQLNNFYLDSSLKALVTGFIFRNLLVILATLLFERTSLPAFRRLTILYKRALAKRRIVKQRAKRCPSEVLKWIDVEIKPI